MAFKYFGDKKKWVNITRDERFFCAHLYCKILDNISPFLQLLYDKPTRLGEKIINAEEIRPDLWEVGYEVCFFRDYIFEFGDQNGNKSIKKSEFSQKRTFDLCLFSENKIIIIEAKSYTGFDTKQLESFGEDKRKIEKLLGDKCPEIFSVALYSELYRPKKESLDAFDTVVYWSDLENIYPDPIFQRANKTDMIVKDV